MLNKIVLAVAGMLVSGVATGAESFSPWDTTGNYAGSYLCIPNAAAGVMWSEASKRWAGTTFNVQGQRTILKIVSAGPKDGYYLGTKHTANSYVISFEDFGSNQAADCSLEGKWSPDPDKRALFISNDGFFTCVAGLSDYRVNLWNMRYIEVYPIGYVSGEDNNNNTPSIKIGKCSKL